MTASALQRGVQGGKLRTALRQPIDATVDDATENRVLFARDKERQAAIRKQARRIRRELLKRSAK